MPTAVNQFKFGAWLVEPALNRLRKGTDEKLLEPKTMAVLAYLLQHPGELVTTEQLMSHAWPGRIVEENAIQQRISKIRRALGDTPRKPMFIGTISGKGYRTIAAVEPSTPQDPENQVSPGHTHTHLKVAVLPLSNPSTDEDRAYFGGGISDDIRTLLAKVPRLSVIARTSSAMFGSSDFDLNEVANELGVNLVVHGTIRSIGSRLRLTVELIHTQTRQVHWTDQFDCNLDELDSIGSRIGRDILYELAPETAMGDTHSKIDAKAYAAYLLGRHLEFTDIATAKKQFELALSIEPTFAAAHAAIAWTHIDAVNFGQASAKLAYPKAQISISKALAADPTQMEALVATNVLIVVLGHDLQDSLYSLNELAVRDPTNERNLLIYMINLIMVNQHSQALKVADHWTRIDPLSAKAHNSRAALLLSMPKPDLTEVLEEIRIVESITGTAALHQRFRLAIYESDTPLAIELAQSLAQAEKGASSLFAQWRAAILAQDNTSAIAIAQKLVGEAIVPAQIRAYAWLQLGDKEKVVASIAEGLEQGQIQVIMALRDNAGPLTFDALPWLHKMPELEPMRRKANVDDASLSKLALPQLPF